MPDGYSEEEVAADCPYINAYCQQRHDGKVVCSFLPEKGRILKSCRAFKQGEVIFREPPLHIVAEQKGNATFERLKELCSQQKKVFEYEPLWYWTALCSLKASQLPGSVEGLKAISEDQQKKLLLLYHSGVNEASEAAKVLVEKLGLGPNLKAIEYERLLQIWILNCFEHSDDPLGYSTYFMSSFMSHSCFPNAVWHYEEDDFVLRARCDIEDQDEICVSYLSEDSLLESVGSRQKHLRDSKHFLCTCSRCVAEQDPGRGFRCPSCKGDVFYCPKSEGKERTAALASCACEKCSRALAVGEAEKLLQEEKFLQEKLDTCEKRMASGRGRHTSLITPLQEALDRCEASLAQHWLMDKAFQILADLMDRNDQPKEAQAFMRRRIAFQERAYTGLSGTRAWTLEAYGDMLIRHASGTVDPHVQVPSEGAAASESLAKTAPAVYADSLRILTLMFGDKHEYTEAVQRKSWELEKELRRYLPTAP